MFFLSKTLEIQIDFQFKKQYNKNRGKFAYIGRKNMNRFFDEVKKNFGFGCMRLPMKDGEVDYEEFSKMVDHFIENGFNYFDTAHGYVGGKSETALRECLTSAENVSKFVRSTWKYESCWSKLLTSLINKRMKECKFARPSSVSRFQGGMKKYLLFC